MVDQALSCSLASLVCSYDADVWNVPIYFPSSYKVPFTVLETVPVHFNNNSKTSFALYFKLVETQEQIYEWICFRYNALLLF